MVDTMCKEDPDFKRIFKARISKMKLNDPTEDYEWCQRRNFTPDKWNEDYRF